MFYRNESENTRQILKWNKPFVIRTESIVFDVFLMCFEVFKVLRSGYKFFFNLTFFKINSSDPQAPPLRLMRRMMCLIIICDVCDVSVFELFDLFDVFDVFDVFDLFDVFDDCVCCAFGVSDNYI